MRDPRVEQVLLSTPNIEWEYKESITLSTINLAKSANNQARIENPVDREIVNRYKNSLLNGDEFPAVVLFMDGDEYVASDGNHRVHAFLAAGRQTADGYIILCSDPVLRAQLTFEWNPINGYGVTDEDSDQHAIYLTNQGLTRKDVAKALHISLGRVEEAVDNDAGHNRAMKLGIKNSWSKIPSRFLRVRLHRALKLDSVFIDAVKLMAKYPVTRNEIGNFITSVTEHGSEADQVDFLKTQMRVLNARAERERKEREAGRRGGGNPLGPPPVHLFEGHLQYLQNAILGEGRCKPFREAVVRGLNTEETKALADKIELTRALLGKAIQELNA